MQRFSFYILGLILLIASFCFQGCVTVNKEIENVSCRFKFSNVERPEDKERILKAIKSKSIGEPKVYGDRNNPEYYFTVKKLKDADMIHPKILFENPSAKGSDLHQTFNVHSKTLIVDYSTIDISASMEVYIRFSITPGARLFYKPYGQSETDITSKVDSNGNVTLRTKIKKGQEYIYAKTVSGGVERHKKINVYTQEVKDISEQEYKEQTSFFSKFKK